MTDNEINTAIAEACGYTFDGENWWHGGYRVRWGNQNGWLDATHPPDYCNDLNAMHVVIKTLNPKKFRSWCDHLMGICEGETFFNATAAQCAEAFLRSIGKWKDARND